MDPAFKSQWYSEEDKNRDIQLHNNEVSVETEVWRRGHVEALINKDVFSGRTKGDFKKGESFVFHIREQISFLFMLISF